MTAETFKKFCNTVYDWNKQCREDRKEGYMYHYNVEMQIGDKVYDCRANDFLDFNGEWLSDDIDLEDMDTYVGYNTGNKLFMVDLEDIQAVQIVDHKELDSK